MHGTQSPTLSSPQPYLRYMDIKEQPSTNPTCLTFGSVLHNFPNDCECDVGRVPDHTHHLTVFVPDHTHPVHLEGRGGRGGGGKEGGGGEGRGGKGREDCSDRLSYSDYIATSIQHKVDLIAEPDGIPWCVD